MLVPPAKLQRDPEVIKNDEPAENPHYVCYECCVAPLLKDLVVRHGEIAMCSLCAANGVKCASTATDDFLLAIKALIRYHFGEWQYHSKLGDGSLEGLFFINPNPILRINPVQADADREDVILSLLSDVNHRQMQVEVITAYGRDIYSHYPHTPVSAGESHILQSARRKLADTNYFLVEDEYEAIIRPIVSYMAETISVGSQWHRARMGAKQRAADFHEIGAPPQYFFEPHKDTAIGAPPVGVATAGRVNRPGVSYLYLASNSETAAAEIRPHPGELVSVGMFEVNKDLRVVDLRTHDLTKLWRSDSQLEMLELIIAMENIFATAAPPSNRSAYTLTQFLGEIFRRLGFDGVLFRSTVGAGDNLVAFNPAHANWVPGSSRAIGVARVRYDWNDVSIFDESANYDIDYEKQSKLFKEGKS
jgi:RES domain-containing protein